MQQDCGLFRPPTPKFEREECLNYPETLIAYSLCCVEIIPAVISVTRIFITIPIPTPTAAWQAALPYLDYHFYC